MPHKTGPVIMGVINCTPDSFYENSRVMDPNQAARIAQNMARDGAQIVDVGGESTRPGSLPIPPDIQIQRVVPAIRAICENTTLMVSIDTQSALVAQAALDAGAKMINDISALLGDRGMALLAAKYRVPIVLMHKKGVPATMQNDPYYEDVLADVKIFFEEAVRRAMSAGIEKEQIILDPGIGFGKRLEDNIQLLCNIDKIRVDNLPILVGLSRKSFIGTITGQPENMRLASTTVAHLRCLQQKVDYLRVHDVCATSDAIRVWELLGWDF